MKTIICILILIFSFPASFSQVTIIPYGDTWRYLDNGSDQGTAWRGTGFNDAGWSSGAGELGYGDNDEATCLSYGCNGNVCYPTDGCSKFITTYFRKTINISDPGIYSNFTFNIERDDGYVVYINGTEVARNNMAASPAVIGYLSTASSAVEDAVITFNVSSIAFAAGDNVIAVEIHQSGATSSDISFNVELIANDVFAASLTRGPYLQMGNQTAITIRWRTSAAQNSRVELGTAFGTYPIVVTDPASVTEHIIRVTGLAVDMKYYYRIGNTTNMGAPDADKFFTTVPLANTTRKVRVAAFGDCGRGYIPYQDQNLSNYRNFLATNNIDAPDAWILLGDNAYDFGTDAEYSSNFFGIYGTNLLKNHKLYPSPGNHDYGNNAANKPSRAMPYYDNFTMPQLGECGGVSSNKPNFYSFDIGNIHFLSLDSWGIETDLTHMGTNGASALKTWINADLALNTQKWTIAYWHHPPYTKGSHNSDTESELQAIRENFITYLETRGVDMIVCGHSHGYERGYMLKNYTGSWASFNSAVHAVSTSSAGFTSNTTCPYVYNTTPLNHGAVYVIAGSAGANGGIQAGYNTGPMPFSVNDGGIFYFEVEDNRLDAKMLRRDGTVFDRFTIMKDVNRSTTYNVVVGNNVTMTASWPGNYNWSTSAATRSIDFSPSTVGTTNFTVTDNFGCITDQFSVVASGALPVSLLAFDVILHANNKVKITWSTASETNNKLFTIERSVNGRDYTKAGTVNAPGLSTIPGDYLFTDESPLAGTSYYRLSQTDWDNRTTFLGIKRIANGISRAFEVNTLSSVNGKIVLQISVANPAKVQLYIFDISGIERKTEKLNIPSGVTKKEINLAAGIYICEIRHEKGEVVFKKIIVQ